MLVESCLVDTDVAPLSTGGLADSGAPCLNRVVFGGCTLPHPSFRFDDPVDLATLGLLHDDPVGMVEA